MRVDEVGARVEQRPAEGAEEMRTVEWPGRQPPEPIGALTHVLHQALVRVRHLRHAYRAPSAATCPELPQEGGEQCLRSAEPQRVDHVQHSGMAGHCGRILVVIEVPSRGAGEQRPGLKDPSSGQPRSLFVWERKPTDEPMLNRRSHIFRRLLILLPAVVLTLLAPTAASAVTGLSATLDGGSFSEFSQTNALHGTLSLSEAQVFDGRASARATYEGNGENGYARGIWNVDWQDGESVWFGAAYYLPVGFLASVQGQVDLMRWDNWSLYPNEADWGGVSIYGSDHRARLLRFGAGRPNDTLVGPTTLPEGRWFTLEVHERLSSGSGALSELYVDGKLVGKSTAPNTYGRPIERIRYGIVAIAEGAQTKPLELWFDEAHASW
jgi:hypothetical protein